MDENINISETMPETMEGGKEQDFTELAVAQGEKGQELAEPAEGDAGEGMSAEERHAQAQKRRNAEREAYRESLREELREEMRRENRQQMDEFIRSQGKLNPYTGKIISSQKELEEYNEENRRRQMEQQFKKAGLDPEYVNEFISSHPDIRAAKEAKQRYEAESEKLKTQNQESGLARELEAIAKIDPTIKGAAELLSHPKYGEIKKLVTENGHSLREAFEIATGSERAAAAQERVRQSTATSAAGKSHMRSTQASGGTVDNTAVPPKVLAGYRAMNPKITMEQARAKWERFNSIKRV